MVRLPPPPAPTECERNSSVHERPPQRLNENPQSVMGQSGAGFLKLATVDLRPGSFSAGWSGVGGGVDAVLNTIGCLAIPGFCPPDARPSQL